MGYIKKIGRDFTQEHRDRIRRGLTGRKLSPQHKANIAKAKTGTPLTDDHKENVRQGVLKAIRNKNEANRKKPADPALQSAH